jgi:hypothetical protein
VISTSDDGSSGTLRDAIQRAQSGDTISFQLPYPATITLGSRLEICPGAGTGPTLTINGPGASNLAISGNHRVRVMDICPGANVAISGLTIEKGSATNETSGYGGGIFNNGGTLTVSNSTLSGNSANAQGGGIFNKVGTLTVRNSTLSSNSAYEGGGISNDRGTLTVTNSTLSGNSANEGGGINGINSDSGTITVTNSTLSANSATNIGGGILNGGGTLTVTNSTLSSNSAHIGGGLFNTFQGAASFKSTIVSGNTGGNCYANPPISSAGYNLSDDGTCGFNATGDQNNVASIGLDPHGLRNNGGPTQTIALLPTSVAVDAIPVSACTDTNGNPVATDQRGISRPQGAGCDIGAFEYVESVPLTFSTSSKLQISGGTSPGFDLNATFTLDPTSNGLNPLTEAVMLQVGTYTVTLPAGSFKALKRGSKQNGYVYEGTIQGVALQLQIVPLSGGAYTLKAEGSPVDLTTLQNPVSVALTIADDAGSTQVYASF